MLELHDVNTYYGPSQVLHDVSLQVNQGEIVWLLGANAAGKIHDDEDHLRPGAPAHAARSLFEGKRLDGRTPTRSSSEGLALVPEGRRVFSRM